MHQPDLPLTVHEYDEWGNPSEDSTVRDYIASYSPCTNLRPQRYPPMLINVGLDDVRVPPMQSVKYINLVRQYDEGRGTKAFVRGWKNAGHEGPRLPNESHRMQAMEISFLMSLLN